MSLYRQTQLTRNTTNQLLSKVRILVFKLRQAERDVSSEERVLEDAIKEEDDVEEHMTKKSLWRLRQSRSMLLKSFNDIKAQLLERGHTIPELAYE